MVGVFKADLSEIASAAGADIAAELNSHGALGTGTREEPLNDDSKNRSYTAVVFNPDNIEVPIMAYVLTRVAPLARAAGLIAN